MTLSSPAFFLGSSGVPQTKLDDLPPLQERFPVRMAPDRFVRNDSGPPPAGSSFDRKVSEDIRLLSLFLTPIR